MNKHDAMIYFANALENIAIAAAATIAAVHFGKPGLLWWLVLIPLNGVSISPVEPE